MLIYMIRYLKGYLTIRITGYSAERFLNACSHRHIFIWGLRPTAEAYEMNITIKGFRQLRPVLRKTGTKVMILKRSGLPFLLYRYRKRKMFFAGAVAGICLILFLSCFLWGIEISGNVHYTDEMLLKFLASREVKSGMRKSELDCGQIVRELRAEYADIIWVSAYTKGTKLYVQIKENEDSVPSEEPDRKVAAQKNKEPVDIRADRECIITDITVRKGVLQVRPGERVKKGEILVSGQVPVLNDAKEVTGYQYCEADADIIGTTELNYEKTCENVYVKKQYETLKKEQGNVQTKYMLTIGNYRFVLGKGKKKQGTFERYGQAKRLGLSESLKFPVIFSVRHAVPYQGETVSYTEKEQQQILSRQFRRYKEELAKKGVEILGNDVKIYRGKDFASAKGNVRVSLPIGEKSPSIKKEIPKKKEEQQGEAIHGNDGSSD